MCSLACTYPARGAAAGGFRQEGLQLGYELVDLLVGDPATAARHRSPHLGSLLVFQLLYVTELDSENVAEPG